MRYLLITISCILAFVCCSDNGTNPIEPSISNPSPADGATGVNKNFTFEWNASGFPVDSTTFDFYLGTTEDPPLEGEGLTESELISIWQRCAVAQEFLQDVYDAQQLYHAQEDIYTYNGGMIWAEVPHLWEDILGLVVDSNDVYTYTMISSPSTFTCTATANLDSDASIDTWTIDETGTLTHTIDDIPTEFESNTAYYWKIVANYGVDSELESDVWQFTSGAE